VCVPVLVKGGGGGSRGPPHLVRVASCVFKHVAYHRPCHFVIELPQHDVWMA
jgi:hypothetical protein